MRKKLKKSDIRKNASLQVSHSINKIKENERKYTIILVIFFMVLFAFFGYYTLSVNNKSKNNFLKDISYGVSRLSSTSDNYILTKDDILNNNEGLEKEKQTITISNDSKKSINYKIVYVIDNTQTKNCNCKDLSINPNDIHYSIDSININTLSDTNQMIVYESEISPKEKQTVEISMWLDESLNKETDYHVHGHFDVYEE